MTQFSQFNGKTVRAHRNLSVVRGENPSACIGLCALSTETVRTVHAQHLAGHLRGKGREGESTFLGAHFSVALQAKRSSFN